MFYLRSSPPAVTLKDVAKEAEVSVATVSRVINGCKNVSMTTKSRVLSAIKTLNYAPNPYAIQLRSQRHTSPLYRKDTSEKSYAERHGTQDDLEALRDQNRRLKRVVRALIRDLARWRSLAEEQVEGL